MIKFTVKDKKEQDEELQSMFYTLNDRFFAGEISTSTTVVFKKDVYDRKDKEPADGHYLPNAQRIEIDEHFRGRHRQWLIVLLHEMAHAWLYQVKEYVGWRQHTGHGMTFQGVLCRLIQIGAYDGIL